MKHDWAYKGDGDLYCKACDKRAPRNPLDIEYHEPCPMRSDPNPNEIQAAIESIAEQLREIKQLLKHGLP